MSASSNGTDLVTDAKHALVDVVGLADQAADRSAYAFRKLDIREARSRSRAERTTHVTVVSLHALSCPTSFES